jgi:8-hydroxy-5-deazaflavin:NADPH oxidoreductase
LTSIGVIGAGHIGRNFSIAAIERGYEIVISNATGPQTLADLVGELGPNARAATAADAAAAGEFSLLAIPLTGAADLPTKSLAGKIVLATCNYFPKRDGHFGDIDSGKLTVPGYLQAQLPESKVIRVFNHIDAADIVRDGTRQATPNRRALGYAGDDPEGKQLAADLYEAFGFDAVDVGGLADAWRLDVDQPTFVVRQNKQELLENLAKAERHVTATS